MQYDVRIQLRIDTSTNWAVSAAILLPGEMAYAIDNGVVKEVKVGIGLTWAQTPTLLIPFAPIVTSYGRNLDTPAAPYTMPHNFKTLNAAMQYILAPYSPPGISISSPANFPIQEVGATYSVANQSFNVAIKNTEGMLLEQSKKKLYVDGNAQDLTDQVKNDTNETIVKSISATKSSSGGVVVLTVGVKRSDDSTIVPATKEVTFRYRSGYFLWPESDDLLGKPTNDLMAILNGLGADVTGVKRSTIDYNGGKSFGTIPFDSTPMGPGKYNIYAFYPQAAGTIVIAPDAFKSTPDAVTHRTFTYTKDVTNTLYTLTKVNKFISGPYLAYMI